MKHNLVSLRINSKLIPRPNCCDKCCLRMRAKWWFKTWYLKHFSVCLKGLRHGYLDYFVRFPLLTAKIRVLIKQICLPPLYQTLQTEKINKLWKNPIAIPFILPRVWTPRALLCTRSVIDNFFSCCEQLFSRFTLLGVSSPCLKFEKFRDTAPLSYLPIFQTPE